MLPSKKNSDLKRPTVRIPQNYLTASALSDAEASSASRGPEGMSSEACGIPGDRALADRLTGAAAPSTPKTVASIWPVVDEIVRGFVVAIANIWNGHAWAEPWYRKLGDELPAAIRVAVEDARAEGVIQVARWSDLDRYLGRRYVDPKIERSRPGTLWRSTPEFDDAHRAAVTTLSALVWSDSDDPARLEDELARAKATAAEMKDVNFEDFIAKRWPAAQLARARRLAGERPSERQWPRSAP